MSTIAHHAFRDLRLACRVLAKSPGFAAAAILMLGVGVGVNTALYSVVEGVLLRPLPFAAPERLTFITREGDVSLPDGVDWRASCPAFEGIALFLRGWSFDLVGDGEPRRLNGSVVEPDFFRVLGTKPLLGRVLLPGDNLPGAPHVIVLAQGFWQRQFGGAADVVGRGVVLSDQPATIVGVMPGEFDFLHDEVDFWIAPAAAVPAFMTERGANNFDAIGRLRPEASLEQGRVELLAISRRLEAEYPKSNRGKLVEPLPLMDFMVGSARRALLVLAGAVGLVMAVAAANLAGLLLARSSVRRDEFALRMAIGAGRGRLVLQLVVEGLLLAVLGGGVGLVLAGWTRDALLRVAPDSLPRAWEIRTNVSALAFGVGVSALAALLASLAPAIAVLRGDPAAWLKSRGSVERGHGARPALSALVTAEVAMAFLLLFGGGLLGRTLQKLQSVDLGFEASGVVKGELVLAESRYGSRAAQSRLFDEVLTNLAKAPGVVSAGYATTTPLDPRGSLGGRILFVDEPPLPPEDGGIGARVRLVHGDYFGTLRIPIREGRAFTARDTAGTEPVAIVNQRFARRFWGGRSPLGRRIAYRDFHDGRPFPMTIVGVAADVKGATLDAPDTLTVYSPYLQRRVEWQRWGTLVARTRTEPASFSGALQAAVWAADPTLPVAEIAPLEERRQRLLAPQRFNAAALATFAAVGLLVALQGLYALLAYTVALRQRELGIRLALGADRRALARLVVGGALSLALVGLVAGVAASFGLQRVLGALLFEVDAADPATYAVVSSVLVLTSLAAAAIPARRATHVEPSVVLRSE